MAWGAEPRDRERSSGRGPEAPGSRAAAAAAQGQGIGISSADFGLIRSRAIVGKGFIGWGRVS
jgi:hypothetical protein